MYEAYWRLDCKPFENTPDPKFLYYSPKHEEALMRLLYAARERKQGAVLTGEYGSGKTVLSRVLLHDLNRAENCQTVLIVNPRISKKEFFKEMLFQMGGEETSLGIEEGTLLRLLEKRVQGTFQQNKRIILIVDEAQSLEEETLEAIRLMLNVQSEEAFYITLVLIGQSELKKRVERVEPLKQRLALRYHLDPLDLPETENYIKHRLRVANRQGLFSKEAVELVFAGSKGIPRQINNICDHALLIGFSRKSPHITADIVENCLQDLDLAKRCRKALAARQKRIEQEEGAGLRRQGSP
ncbi:MAG: AAA family ATPase [Deltaproteobacteria bacterium]|nr:AAA family ATPase [Deltaproteobacteria bacterium]